jgi:hypothetical protein
MSLRAWRTAYASVVGTSHSATGVECQDAGRCAVIQDSQGSDVLVAAVSDGAGTAPCSARGAALTVNAFLDAASAEVSLAAGDLAFFDHGFASRWLAGVRAEISLLAAAEGRSPKDYACTFLGAVVGNRAAGYVQIGDGAIVVLDGPSSQPRCVFWPQHGEFANSTFFVTQDGADEVLLLARSTCAEGESAVLEVAMFSDGLERLVLNFATKDVHAPALAPILAWLAGQIPADTCGPSDALIAYLGSQHVNRRTDDDKTLVLATRADPPDAAVAGVGA